MVSHKEGKTTTS